MHLLMTTDTDHTTMTSNDLYSDDATYNDVTNDSDVHMRRFTPESVRWLVLHNRMEEAEKAIQRVVIMNRKPMPDLEVIRKVARREVERENRGGRKYTYLDLFKGWRLVRSTLCFSFTW